jgi:vacuolar-type H+-ATPase subunit H
MIKQMERKEILEKLKTTEAEIRSKIEAAQHKRNEILTQAQKQAQKLEDDGERKLKTERERLLAAAKKEIDAKRQRILKKAMAEAGELKRKVQMKKAKEFFIEKFEEYIHV